MNIKAVISLAVFAFFMPVVSLALVTTSPLLPLYVTHNLDYTDYFYTTSASQRDAALSYGYQDLGKSAYVEYTNVNGAQPFARYVKMAPQFEHFYTISAAEQSFITTYLGYISEGYEGWIYPSQAYGTVPFYRVYSWNQITGDVQHYYTTNVADYQSLVSQGWGNDGITGYVWAVPEPSRIASVNWFQDTETYAFNGFYIQIPEVYTYDFMVDGTCTGTVDVYIDGQWRTTIGAWTNFFRPGSFNIWSCYSTLPYFPSWAPGQHTLRLEFSGYSFLRQLFPLPPWQTIPPSTYQDNFFVH